MSYSDFIISPKDLFAKKDDPNLVIVDCPWEQGSYIRAHIPGAVHLEWNRFLNNSTNPEAVRDFRPVDELKTLVDEAGITRDCTVVTHCQAVVRGTMGVFVLEMLGYPRVRLYDGSMAEWANLDDTPLE